MNQSWIGRLAPAALLIVALQGCDSGGSSMRPMPPAQEPPPAPPANGLDARPANATCLAWPRATGGGQISTTRFTDLLFNQPVSLLQAPGDSSRWFVVQQDGIVRQFDASNPTSASNFIDIDSRVETAGEMGLLGMAFHPNFPTDNRVFLSYTALTPQVEIRISVFTSADGGATLDPASEVILLRITKDHDNHNGGHIAFGPDGYLYIGVGDGGGAGDDHGDRGNGQRLTTMLGKMLRIDVNGAAPYAIPPTNPFAGNALCPAEGRATGECPEIYAYGLRNPWRWSFDRANGELWLGDVGQSQYEEVNQITLGGNYGWRCREGAHDYFSSGTAGCSSAALIDPIVEFDHTLGSAITGGYVYRGQQSTGLQGRYLFADFGSGRIWAWLAEDATAPRAPTQLLDTNFTISTFGEDHDGELYITDYYAGRLYRINFEPGAGGAPAVDLAPERLSETGCVSSNDPRSPAPGLIPYTINASFWSDGASKDRWMALPDGQNVAVEADGDWTFPEGTVLMKNFRVGTRLIESRLFVRHPDGVWGGFSYEWNAEQTDATLLRGGAVRDIGAGRSWIFPSESQCLQCHTQVTGRALGLETAQLNRSHLYPQTGRTANELTTLNHIGILTPAITDVASQPALPNPFGDTGTLAERARAYLHTNCSQCHRPGGPTPSTMDLRYTTELLATYACDALPQSGDLGMGSDARLLAPGQAANSLIVNRMNRRDTAAMPPLASTTVDSSGVALVSRWIDSLTSCQ